MKSSNKISPDEFAKYDEDSRSYERLKIKLHALEKNISALCDSEMDRAHKKFVLAVLYDYKETLLKRLESRDFGLH